MPKILLVDDEPLNLDYLGQEFEDLDLEILTAGNGQEALDAVVQHRPDMVFLDLMMPVMDGFAVLQRLKADPTSNGISVVIISAASDMQSVAKGIEMGADDFLPKPFDPVLLRARLNAGLEKKRLRDMEQRYLRSLERELEIGRRIQAGFLPEEIPQPRGWDIAAFFRPAREVSGDFYDVFELEEGKLALLIGDVTDKGVGSALYMALFRSLLRATVMLERLSDCADSRQETKPEGRLKRAVTLVNNYICTVHRSAMFATLFFGVVDLDSGELTYVSAGHDRPLIVREGSIHAELRPTGPLVGALAGADFGAEALQLEPADTLVLYSDGITDARNLDKERFGRERWYRSLAQPAFSARDLIVQLTASVSDFAGDVPQFDDMTLLVVRRLSQR